MHAQSMKFFLSLNFISVDIDECLVGSPCSEDAECTNYNGSYTCSCNAGFSGDGVFCLSE